MDEIKEVYFPYESNGVALDIRLKIDNRQVVISWLPVSLGGPYPGGAVQIVEPKLKFFRASEGPPVEVPLIRQGGVGGLEIAHTTSLQPMFKEPAVCAIPLTKGTYRVVLSMEEGCGVNESPRPVDAELGTFELNDHRLGADPHLTIMQGRMIKWPDKEKIAQVPPQTVESRPDEYFAPQNFLGDEIRTMAFHLWENNLCPGESCHYAQKPHDIRWAHSRAYGFCMEALAPAFLLTGYPLYWKGLLYCEDILRNNTTQMPGGSLNCDFPSMHEIQHALHTGILGCGFVALYRVVRDKERLRPAYQMMQNWPWDDQSEVPAISITRKGVQYQTGVVYDMLAELAFPMYVCGEIFEDQSLRELARRTVEEVIVGEMNQEGFFPYMRGSRGISAHYGLFTTYSLARLAHFTEWPDKEGLTDVIQRATEYAVHNYAFRHYEGKENHLIWSDRYGPTERATKALSLTKAAFASFCLAYLAVHRDEKYLEPLACTIRYIYSHKYTPDMEYMQKLSWFAQGIYAPLLELPTMGIRFCGNGLDADFLELELADRS